MIKKILMVMAMLVLVIAPVSAYTFNRGEARIGAFYGTALSPMAHYSYVAPAVVGGSFSYAHITNARPTFVDAYPRTYYPHVSRPYAQAGHSYYGAGRYSYLVGSSGQSGYRGVVRGSDDQQQAWY